MQKKKKKKEKRIHIKYNNLLKSIVATLLQYKNSNKHKRDHLVSLASHNGWREMPPNLTL